MNIESYDIVTAKRPCDEEAFTGLVLGSCDTNEIFTLLVRTDSSHAFGEAWMIRYAGRNSINNVEVSDEQ